MRKWSKEIEAWLAGKELEYTTKMLEEWVSMGLMPYVNPIGYPEYEWRIAEQKVVDLEIFADTSIPCIFTVPDHGEEAIDHGFLEEIADFQGEIRYGRGLGNNREFFTKCKPYMHTWFSVFNDTVPSPQACRDAGFDVEYSGTYGMYKIVCLKHGYYYPWEL